jgi:hypothetical protein
MVVNAKVEGLKEGKLGGLENQESQGDIDHL